MSKKHLYRNLNRLGMLATEQGQLLFGATAATLRQLHARHPKDDPDDLLLELADQLDTLAAPIAVAVRHD